MFLLLFLHLLLDQQILAAGILEQPLLLLPLLLDLQPPRLLLLLRRLLLLERVLITEQSSIVHEHLFPDLLLDLEVVGVCHDGVDLLALVLLGGG